VTLARSCLRRLRGAGQVEDVPDDYDPDAERIRKQAQRRKKAEELKYKKERILAVKTTIMSLQKEIRDLEDDVLRLQKEEKEILEKERPPAQVLEDPNKIPSAKAKKEPLPEQHYSDDGEDTSALKPNNENGGSVVGGYPCHWTQTIADLELFLQLPENTTSKDVIVESSPYFLKIGIKGQPWMIDGKLFSPVKSGDTYWTVDQKNVLNVELHKLHADQWWSRVIETDPKINPRLCSPGEQSIGEIDDPEMKQTVEKMLWKQHCKQKGLPLPEDEKKKQVMADFMKAHPEMDFSKAKFQ